jgi:hypothetical protein
MAQTRRELEDVMNVDALTAAIGDYFRGERQEMLAILACSTGLLLLAAALHAVGRDGFSRGFGLTALLLAVMLSSTAASLLLRDPPHQARLVAAGVLLLVVAQLTIDHYSEARATRYAGQLGAALVAPVPARPR